MKLWPARNGKHVLVAYIMKPKAGYDYLATAAHFAAESSTGTNVNVCTTDDFTKSVDALVYYIDPDSEEMKIAYPTLLFDRNIIDGRGMMCSFLTLAIGNNQGQMLSIAQTLRCKGALRLLLALRHPILCDVACLRYG